MNMREARKRIVGYLISTLEQAGTCDDEKSNVSNTDYERLCQAEIEIAKELRERYNLPSAVRRTDEAG